MVEVQEFMWRAQTFWGSSEESLWLCSGCAVAVDCPSIARRLPVDSFQTCFSKSKKVFGGISWVRNLAMKAPDFLRSSEECFGLSMAGQWPGSDCRWLSIVCRWSGSDCQFPFDGSQPTFQTRKKCLGNEWLGSKNLCWRPGLFRRFGGMFLDVQ